MIGAHSEVLDVGRQTNRWPVAIRRAITARDRGCVFPGCDRPPSWTDIHHCTPWTMMAGRRPSTMARSSVDAITRSSTAYRWRITIDNGRPIRTRGGPLG